MSILAEAQASRQDYISAVVFVAPGQPCTRAGEVDPSAIRFQDVERFRFVPGAGGVWLECHFGYRSGSSGPYVLTASVHYDCDLAQTGRVYLRSCTCGDWAKRDAKGAVGEARLCKHLIALRHRVQSEAGQALDQTACVSPTFGQQSDLSLPLANPVLARQRAIYAGFAGGPGGCAAPVALADGRMA